LTDPVDPVAEILADWTAARRSGEGPTLDELCAAHPEYAAELRTRAAMLQALGDELGRQAEGPPVHLALLRSERYGRFRPAGEGGMGIVYWAIDSDLNREVAFKVVRPASPAHDRGAPAEPMELSPPADGTPASAAFATLKARFLQEAWVTAGMSHPGIVPVYELGETPQGVPFYTMRFVRGNRTLARAIDEVRGRPWEERLPLLEPFLKVCDTLSYAHAKGVVHRDVKPDNVALGEFGEVVVLDWGLAKISDREDVVGEAWKDRIREFRDTADLRTLASAMGTPGYMSPEAALGRVDEVDARSDVYSLGAILYRILTGRLPFEFTTFVDLVRQLMAGTPPAPSAVDPGVPDELSAICVRALSKNREARPESADAFAAEIRGWQTRRSLDRESDALLRDARGALETASGLTGAAAAGEIDRAAAVVARALGLRPDDEAACALAADIARRREATMAERERAARRRTVRRAATIALAATAVAAVVVATLLEGERRETTAARDLARQERDAKSAALDAESAARRRALAFALAQASAEPLTTTPQLALLLARESLRVEPTPDGISRLHDALAGCKERVRFRSDRADELGARARAVVFVGDGSRVAGIDSLGSVFLWTDGGRDLATFDGHVGMALDLVASADGSRFAVSGHGRAASLWAADGTPVAVLGGHVGLVSCVRVDRTGHRVLTVDARRARLWDDSPRVLATVGEDANPPIVGDVAPDGRTFATGAADGSLSLWDETGRRVAVRSAAGARVNAVQFSPEGASVVAVGSDGKISVWTAGGEPLAKFDVPSIPGTGSVDCRATFSPDGQRVLAWGADGTVQIRDLAGVELLRIPGDARQLKFRWSYPLLAACSNDGRRIAVSSLTGEIRVYSSDGRKLACLRGYPNQPACMQFSRDGRRLLSTAPNGGPLLWEIDSDEDFHLPSEGAECAMPPSLSRDGRRLYSGRTDGTRRLRDLDSDSVVALASHGRGTARTSRATLSLDGRRVATAWQDEPPTVEDLVGGAPVVLSGHESHVSDTAFSPDGTLVATAGNDRTARLWRVSGEPVAVLRGHVSEVSRVTFSPDGRLVASGSRDGEVRVYDLTGQCLAHWGDLDVEVMGLAFSPDSRSVAACSFRTNSVCVFDVGGALRWGKHNVGMRLGGHLSDLEWSPDGSHLLTMSLGGPVHVWRADGSQRAVLRASEGGLLRATFSPDGTLVAAATDAREAVIFDIDGHRIASVRVDASSVQDVAFTPDGRFLVTAAGDGSVSRWFVRTEDLVRRADERVTRIFSKDEGERYEALLGDEDRRRVRALRLVDAAAVDHPLLADVIVDIEARPGLDEGDRRAATEIARGRRDDFRRLVAAAWAVVVEPEPPQKELRDAVRWAEIGARLAPESEYSQATLGACLLRSGRTDEALDALHRADTLARSGGGPGVVDASEFLAMAYADKGNLAEADRHLAAARALGADPRTPASTKKLIAEAARRVEEARAKR
jgi:WD40 repeat protein/serine/threonine protein kinase